MPAVATKRDVTWTKLKKMALSLAEKRSLSNEYLDRLKLEIKEIEKQGAQNRWIGLFNDNYKYETNKNGLVLPWLLKMTNVDPLQAEHEVIQQTDWPDIDFDCLPEARDHIKKYAADKYGSSHVCSVGAWQTYKFKSALQDAARGLGEDFRVALKLTKELPDDVDNLKDGGFSECSQCKTRHKDALCPECGSAETEGITLGQLKEEYEVLAKFTEEYPRVVEMAARMVGKIKTMGKHAGGLIISSVPLMGNVPMGISKGTNGEKQWTSMWTEGRNTQLSKLGFIKWDVLGLKTLQYIHDACKLIKKTRNVEFDIIPWEENNPEDNCLGYYTDDLGKRHKVVMDDPEVFQMINDIRTEAIFQFETDVQKGVLRNGVLDYYDLQVFNAMGHPGPIAFIPEYVERRNDENESWRNNEHKGIADSLADTHGIIVYQEQLQAIWQKFANFTAPEGESARKAIAKKHTEKLKGIEAQWLKGSIKILGKDLAEEMWERMKTFGRYAFNKSHSCAYIMVAYWCAYLKVHFAPEWWAAVMSGCHSDRIPKYMETAREEGVKFGTINVEEPTTKFSVDGNFKVTPGLASIKGIGKKAAEKLEGAGKQEISNIDDFVTAHGKSKTVLQRLILLGAFQKYHPNIKATWMWYQYRYCTGKDITALKSDINEQLLGEWTEEKIEAERKRQEMEYRKLYPNRRVLPKKIENWKPKPNATRENVMALFPEDFTLKERLVNEKEYLGYYWHSPMDVWQTTGDYTIMKLKSGEDERGITEGVIDSISLSNTKNGTKMARVKITDGISSITVILWESQWNDFGRNLKEGRGYRFRLKYDPDRNSCTLQRNKTNQAYEPIVLDSV